jgi:hypothetical protein
MPHPCEVTVKRGNPSDAENERLEMIPWCDRSDVYPARVVGSCTERRRRPEHPSSSVSSKTSLYRRSRCVNLSSEGEDATSINVVSRNVKWASITCLHRNLDRQRKLPSLVQGAKE